MAVYIKDMEIPKNCEECRMAEVPYDLFYGFCHATNKWFDDEWFVWSQYEEGDIDMTKPLNCPLVYIPKPLFDNKRKKGDE